MPHADFVHLHCHTQFSLLDAASKIPELIHRAVELKFPALAMTDHGNLFGAIEFYSQAMKQGVKPIIGMEAYIAPGSRFDKQAHGIKEASFHITLLARNEVGYRNLMKLTSIGYLEGFYYRPRIDKEMLKKHSEGLIALSGCLKGEIPYMLRNDQPEEAKRAIREYIEILGKENLFFEIMNQGLAPQKKLAEDYLKLSKEFGIRLVATNDSHYIYRHNASSHDALICIGTGSMITDTNRMRYEGDQFYLKSAEEMKILFKDYPDALKATLDIAERCNLELDFNKTHLPVFTAPKGKTLEGYLEELCFQKLRERREGEIPADYASRLKYELTIINKMGYTSYFLIVWDFIRYARESGIPVGPGRGSAAGSLVAYALSITDIDPIKHSLIFERFLNPDRISLPDIDIDFCYERRDEVIDYVKRKYGTENVAQIITFGTMAAKAVVRDVGRVMGFSYPEVDLIAKMIPMELNITIQGAIEREPKLKELSTTDSRVGQLIETSKALEGITRHASTHAAGVVIADKPLTDYVPLFKANEQISTQYSMKDLEKIGLLKMDFLGLKTLTMIDQTLKILQKTKNITVDIGGLPFDDAPTYAMLGRAESAGVFQLESSGMRDLLRKMKPNCFDHLVALLAIFRPGPLGSGMVDDFIQRMHNTSSIKYDHPALEPILKETYGVILYQEQVMQIVSALAGFTLAQADSLRRAIGKKIPEIMDREKKAFIDGAVKKGVRPPVAEKIWNLIDYFSGYGFNKSHSTAYAFISYQTAYLKAHYPLEFMTALLTSEMGNTDKVVRYIEESKKMGIQVLPPSVNESVAEFTCAQNYIRFGLNAIKNVGSTAIDSVLAERKKDGPFKSFFDFTKRVDLRVCNRKVLESLIKCGAFDEFKLHRAQLMAMIDRALEMGAGLQRDKSRGQLSFFSGGAQTVAEFSDSEHDDVPNIPEWPEGQRLSYERELIGFYVTSHPLSQYAKLLKNYATATTDNLNEFRDQQEVTIGGLIDNIKEIVTKKGDKMGFITLQDLSGTCEVVTFPEIYRTAQALIKKDSPVFVRGKINSRDDVPKILAEEIVALEDVKKRFTRLISIDLRTTGLDPELLKEIRRILQTHKGSIPVYLSFRDPSGKSIVLHSGEDLRVESSDQLFEALEQLVGESAVKIR
ncbi:MAG: DNA polymerase III subunit alpha [Candidatus Omnitrophica bacterium]|nr:DNA polymerase III subunit alpha [Candidatus Omnitrophota bacterium]